MTDRLIYQPYNAANRSTLRAAVREAYKRAGPTYFGLSASRRLWVDVEGRLCVKWSVDFDDYGTDGKVPLCSAANWKRQTHGATVDKIIRSWKPHGT